MRRESSLLALTGAATTLASALLAGEADSKHVRRLVSETSAATNLDPDAAAWCLFTLAIRDRALLAAEPAAALRAQVRGLVILTSVDHASLWLVAPGPARCLAQAGASVKNAPLRAAARSALTDSRRAAETEFRAVPVETHGIRCGALVYRLRRAGIKRANAYAAETALAASAILERQARLDRAVVSGEQLLELVERRVSRIGFDIHDGPLQKLSLVAGELSAVGRHLQTVETDETVELVREKLSELKALVIDAAAEVRTIASAAAPGRLDLRETLEREIARFEASAGIPVDHELIGDLGAMTASQRIAATRVVEEALANVREHSGATRVKVSLLLSDTHLELLVADNGRGFDVARTRRRAHRERCLGLIGMEQRMRLLGGELGVTSRPGGPTVVSASVPTWKPNGPQEL